MRIISAPLASSLGKAFSTNIAWNSHQKGCKSRRQKGCLRVLFLDTAVLHYFGNNFLLCTLNYSIGNVFFKLPFQSLFLYSSLVGHF